VAGTFGLVIPTYNRRSLVSETVLSALSQSLPFDEIVVVDDGSSDDTVVHLRREFPQIRVIEATRGGVQAARNAGVEALNTEWVVLCDSDDLLCRDYLRVTAGNLDQEPEISASYCNFVVFGALSDSDVGFDKFASAPKGFFNDFESIGGGYLCSGSDDALRLLTYQPLFPSGLCIRRECFVRLGGFDKGLAGVGSEDLEFTFRLVVGERVALFGEPLVRVRKHAENDSASLFRQLNGEATILRMVAKEHCWAREHQAQLYREADVRIVNAIRYAFQTGQWSVLQEREGLTPSCELRAGDLARLRIARSGPAIQWVARRILQLKHWIVSGWRE
jgi:glycosyltransferase involved in cell wall biosynthesis